MKNPADAGRTIPSSRILLSNVQLGQRVTCTGARYAGSLGTVRYIGEIEGERGTFVRIEFDRPETHGDGFSPDCGGFVPVEDVQKVHCIINVILS